MSTIIGVPGYGDVACQLRKVPESDSGSAADFELIVFGARFQEADVAIEYRLYFGQEWQSDAALTASSAGIPMGNILSGLPCSSGGTATRFRWRYYNNGISQGQTADIRARVLSVPTVFSACNSRGVPEHLGDPARPSAWFQVPYYIMNTDNDGGYLCSDGGSTFRVVDPVTGLSLVVSTGFTALAHACQLPWGNYLLLDSGSSCLVEVDPLGAVVRSFCQPSLFLSPRHFAYDQVTENVLITGGTIPMAYELSWSDDYYGTVSWTFGYPSPGPGDDHLDSPSGIAYHPFDASVVAIADTGNNRIVVVDRGSGPDDVTITSSMAVDGTAIPLAEPYYVELDHDGNIITSTATGRRLYFSETRASHPTIARWESRRTGAISGMDTIPQLRGAVYTPVPVPIRRDS